MNQPTERPVPYCYKGSPRLKSACSAAALTGPTRRGLPPGTSSEFGQDRDHDITTDRSRPSQRFATPARASVENGICSVPPSKRLDSSGNLTGARVSRSHAHHVGSVYAW